VSLCKCSCTGRLLGAYNLGVATPRALVYAGLMTGGDARSWLNSESMSELELQVSSSSVGLLKGVGPCVGNVETTSMNNVSVVDVSSLGGWVPDVAVTVQNGAAILNSRHITKFCDGLNAMKLCDDAGKH
ncbi:hypothetical protein Tco_0462836, partial [Tanacetum coccineum]